MTRRFVFNKRNNATLVLLQEASFRTLRIYSRDQLSPAGAGARENARQSRAGIKIYRVIRSIEGFTKSRSFVTYVYTRTLRTIV